MWLLLSTVVALTDIRGTVLDATTGVPVPGVTIQALGMPGTTVSDSAGAFTLDVPRGSTIRLARLGYVTKEVAVNDSVVEVRLTPQARSLEGVTVTALRAEGGRTSTPITQKIVRQDELERQYAGQEMPFLLAGTPAVTTYSDGGAYSNYTYLRLRGIDQTRVNITLDGVPLNDAEDQGVFFSNFPDFANSIQSVQVQRGVGTSSQGVASFAGSINFESVALASSTRRGELHLSRGAFNTTRASAEWQSGLLPNRVAFHGRASAQDTDGYRHNGGNRSFGGFLSAGYFGDRTSAKLTALSGVSKNQLAYLASSLADIEADPRHNPLPTSDRDRFTQSLASLAVTRLVGQSASVSATAYTVSAGGDYDVTFGSDISNFNLASRVTGAFATLNRQVGNLTLNTGLHANTYHRDHFLAVRPALQDELYRNTGEKDEASAFLKAVHERGRVTVLGDVQLRGAWYRYLPSGNAGIAPMSIDWGFINPRIGVSVAATPSTSVYATFGRTGREPTRNDMFAGFDNIDTTNAAFVGGLGRVRPEFVNNVEGGISHRGRSLDLNLSAFDMQFRNEITPVGALSYIGLPLRKNVGSSRRSGLELDGLWRGHSRMVIGANATWMRARIAEYTDDATQQSYRDVVPLLTPAFTGNHSAQFLVSGAVRVSLDGRYVGRSFLANTSDARFVTPPGYVLDGAATWTTTRVSVMVLLRNALDRRFFSGGYTDGSTSYYYIWAPRNLMLTTRVQF